MTDHKFGAGSEADRLSAEYRRLIEAGKYADADRVRASLNMLLAGETHRGERMTEMQILEDAKELLTGAPWHWTVTIDYPGYLWITFADGTRHYGYAAGFANPTLTVDQ